MKKAKSTKAARMTLADLQKSKARIVSITNISPVHRQIACRKAVKGIESESRPHLILWLAIQDKWPDRARKEFSGAVPGRQFRIDIAFEPERLAIEIDGWQWHGKHLGDFIRDRERQNLMVVNGWRILRFSAGMIYKDLPQQLDLIAQALQPNSTIHANVQKIRDGNGRYE